MSKRWLISGRVQYPWHFACKMRVRVVTPVGKYTRKMRGYVGVDTLVQCVVFILTPPPGASAHSATTGNRYGYTTAVAAGAGARFSLLITASVPLTVAHFAWRRASYRLRLNEGIGSAWCYTCRAPQIGGMPVLRSQGGTGEGKVVAKNSGAEGHVVPRQRVPPMSRGVVQYRARVTAIHGPAQCQGRKPEMPLGPGKDKGLQPSAIRSVVAKDAEGGSPAPLSDDEHLRRRAWQLLIACPAAK